jgi:hypothetical protein
MLTLTEKDLQELNAFIQELPLKHGLPLLNFLNAKLAEKKQETQEVLKQSKDITENIKS